MYISVHRSQRFHDFQILHQNVLEYSSEKSPKCVLIIYMTDRIWSEIHEQTITINGTDCACACIWAFSLTLISRYLSFRFLFILFCAMGIFTRENVQGGGFKHHTKLLNRKKSFKMFSILFGAMAQCLLQINKLHLNISRPKSNNFLELRTTKRYFIYIIFYIKSR